VSTWTMLMMFRPSVVFKRDAKGKGRKGEISKQDIKSHTQGSEPTQHHRCSEQVHCTLTRSLVPSAVPF
jgi:hypothetical protein